MSIAGGKQSTSTSTGQSTWQPTESDTLSTSRLMCCHTANPNEYDSSEVTRASNAYVEINTQYVTDRSLHEVGSHRYE